MTDTNAFRTDGSKRIDATRIRVGVSEYAVSTRGVALSTSGLGSCVGVALYDPETGIGGLGHVMLPAATTAVPKPGKFADTCIPALLKGMVRAGADPDRIRSKLAGGSSSMEFSTTRHVGNQNAAAIRDALEANDVSVVAADLGGSHGRSLLFHPTTGALEVNGSDGTRKVL